MRIVRGLARWFEDRTGIADALGRVLKHPVPPNTGWWYVFGSATLLALVLQVVTGTALASLYVPSTESAYQSLQFITHRALLGSWLRGLHYFGASAMVFLVGVHAIRVFVMGSYKFPREVNWLTGAVLLLLVLAMGFTGQLLRWDQNAVWAVVVGAEQAGRVPWIGRALAHLILGGSVISGATLSRFFALHVFLVPALLFVGIGLHLFLVVRNGISEPPRPGHVVNPKTYRADYAALLRSEGRPFWPDAAWRDVVAGLVLLVVLIALAWWVGPPKLDKPPDPALVKANPRPDWYLMWYFALLALMPRSLEGYVMVLGPLALGFALFALPLVFGRGERSPRRRPWAVASACLVVASIAVLTRSGNLAPWSPDFSTKPLSATVIGAQSGPVHDGAMLFYQKGCQYCHAVRGHGGHRGPDLTTVADRLNARQLTLRILNGKGNMPGFASMLSPDELGTLMTFLQTLKRQTREQAAASAVRAKTAGHNVISHAAYAWPPPSAPKEGPPEEMK